MYAGRGRLGSRSVCRPLERRAATGRNSHQSDASQHNSGVPRFATTRHRVTLGFKNVRSATPCSGRHRTHDMRQDLCVSIYPNPANRARSNSREPVGGWDSLRFTYTTVYCVSAESAHGYGWTLHRRSAMLLNGFFPRSYLGWVRGANNRISSLRSGGSNPNRV